MLDYPSGPSVILKKRTFLSYSQKQRDVTTEAGSKRVCVAGFEDGGRGHEPRHLGGL